MPNYTPGPWFTTEDKEGVIDSAGWNICAMNYAPDYTVLEANAKLIAAAPELAEIVKEAANMIEYVLDDGYSFEGGKELLEKMRKVIFKIA